jgi:pyruvate/2-oxoglutarate dehydrogenase complex dihydrolipoamide acyltransferase (E2) component
MNFSDIVVPEFDLAGIPLVICAWLVAPGERVYEGDRVLEILAGEVTIDLGSPAAGVLLEQLATEDETVAVGQIVGRIAVEPQD